MAGRGGVASSWDAARRSLSRCVVSPHQPQTRAAATSSRALAQGLCVAPRIPRPVVWAPAAHADVTRVHDDCAVGCRPALPALHLPAPSLWTLLPPAIPQGRTSAPCGVSRAHRCPARAALLGKRRRHHKCRHPLTSAAPLSHAACCSLYRQGCQPCVRQPACPAPFPSRWPPCTPTGAPPLAGRRAHTAPLNDAAPSFPAVHLMLK